jgi:hypothetical protein
MALIGAKRSLLGVDPSETLSPLLDGYTTGLTGAWSTWQQLLTSYEGDALRIRESGGDTEADIGFTDGVLDEAAAAAHIGGGSGFVRTLYDQSGNARTFVQATTASQPAYATGIGPQSRPAADFDGVDDVLASAATLDNLFNNDAGYAVVSVLVDGLSRNNAVSYNNHAVWTDAGVYAGVFVRVGPINYSFNWDGGEDKAAGSFSTGSVVVFEWRHQGANLYQRVDGANETDSSGSGVTTTLTGALQLGGLVGVDGKILDFITYDAVPDLATRDAIVAGLLARLT